MKLTLAAAVALQLAAGTTADLSDSPAPSGVVVAQAPSQLQAPGPGVPTSPPAPQGSTVPWILAPPPPPPATSTPPYPPQPAAPAELPALPPPPPPPFSPYAAPIYTPPPTPPAVVKPIVRVPSLFVRLALGVGWAMPSDEYGVLRKDGFSMGVRYHVMADASALVWDRVGFGAWAGFAGNSWNGDYGGETLGTQVSHASLDQRVGYVGVQVPLYLLARPVVAFTPRLGLAWGTLSLHGGSDWQTTWTGGFDLSIMERIGQGPVYLGGAVGVLWAPTTIAGSVANYDMGGWFFSLVGGYGG